MKVIDTLIKENKIFPHQKHNKTMKLWLRVGAGPCWAVCLKVGRSFLTPGSGVSLPLLSQEASNILIAVTSVKFYRKERHSSGYNLEMRQTPLRAILQYLQYYQGHGLRGRLLHVIITKWETGWKGRKKEREISPKMSLKCKFQNRWRNLA